MNWEKPEVVEVNMSAEIGAYQDDSGERDETPIVSDEMSAAE
jgi:coenzyme PQQ precursor peptide PqqA